VEDNQFHPNDTLQVRHDSIPVSIGKSIAAQRRTFQTDFKPYWTFSGLLFDGSVDMILEICF
jgi:hypothetical protein